MNLDPSALPSEVANRMLGREAWARERLATHAGRVFIVSVGPVSAGFRIDSDGTLRNAPLAGGNCDLQLTLSPFQLPTFLADPRQWSQCIVEDGDVELGGTLKELAQTLPWFVEQAFAQVLGPIAGQRAADTGRQLLAFPGYAAERVAESIARYARDEARLVARGEEMRSLAADAAALSARVAVLDERIAALAQRMSSARPTPARL
jgi:ubiquinone biosynthesis protein UbiJ